MATDMEAGMARDSGADCRVLVLLPVFNGAAWLGEQLDSIFGQHGGLDVSVLCRDDGSTDGSLSILEAYLKRHPGHFHLLRDAEGNLGASASFSRLMQEALDSHLTQRSGCVYVALSDQDDIWHPDRLNCCVDTMRQQEARNTPDCPLLIHSDLRVIDRHRQLIAPSLAEYQGLQPYRQGLVVQLLSNSVTGCTVLLNAALLRKSLPVPPEAVMHDWWLSVVAGVFGRRVYIDRPLVDYRQHGGNALGARCRAAPAGLSGIVGRLSDSRSRKALDEAGRQARVFLARYGDSMPARQWLAAGLVARMESMPGLVKRLLYRVVVKPGRR